MRMSPRPKQSSSNEHCFGYGDARGRWEGGTLVVDVTNFTENTAIPANDARSSVLARINGEIRHWGVILEAIVGSLGAWRELLPRTRTSAAHARICIWSSESPAISDQKFSAFPRTGLIPPWKLPWSRTTRGSPFSS